MGTPTLFIFAGLPGSGKTELSQYLAGRVGAFHLRIDTIEQALRDLCEISVEGEGYRLAYRIAADNLRLGLSVVADSCNPIALTRREWQEVAEIEGAKSINIEVICSDSAEHRRRVESRKPAIPTLELPTWEEVVRREYQPWDESRITIDTAGRSLEASCTELRSLIGLAYRTSAAKIAPTNYRSDMAANEYEPYSTLTCPECGLKSRDLMPTNACQYLYDCKSCGAVLKPEPGDCCVYCSLRWRLPPSAHIICSIHGLV